MATSKERRDQMLAGLYVPPASGAATDLRVAGALEYIALYLGEIEKHLGEIAKQGTANSAVIASGLQNIQTQIAKSIR